MIGWRVGAGVELLLDNRQEERTARQRVCEKTLDEIYIDGGDLIKENGEIYWKKTENKERVTNNLPERLRGLRQYLEECVQTNY